MTEVIQYNRDQIKTLLRLPSTAEARGALEKIQLWQSAENGYTGQEGSRFGATYQEELVRRCEERDALRATRPDGCWCLGLGEDKGTGQFCHCPEGKTALEEYFQSQRVKKQAAMESRWERLIPQRFRGFRLETSPLKEIAERMRDDESDLTTSWFLSGEYGVGKTGLAVGYARRAIIRGRSVLFTTVPDLLTALRATYSPGDGPLEQEVLERYTGVNLLVLDDLGAEQVKNQDWVADRLYQIIGARHSKEKATVFTSNLSIEQVAGRIGERITWRIVEMVGADHIINVDGPNLRTL